MILLTVMSIAIQCVTSQLLADDELLQELIQKRADYINRWSEGFIDARMEGPGGMMADGTAYWVGDRSRRVMNDFGIDGKQEPELRDISFNSQTFCRFSPQSLLAHCGRRIEYPKMQQMFRVLPTESWQEIGYGGTTIDNWFKQEFISSGGKHVFRAADGYDVYLGRKDEVAKCVASVAAGVSSPVITEGESVVRNHFNRHGLLESNEYFGAIPKFSLLINNQWTDDVVPMPKVLLVRSRKFPAKEYDLTMRITVREVDNRLPRDAPSLAVPPTDLPFGSKVMNKLNDPPSTTYIGGDSGQAHYELNRSGRRLQEAIAK